MCAILDYGADALSPPPNHAWQVTIPIGDIDIITSLNHTAKCRNQHFWKRPFTRSRCTTKIYWFCWALAMHISIINTYILHFLDHFDSPCRCWRCFGLCPGLQIKLIFMEAAMLKWPAGNCKIHHAHSSIAVLYDPCMYSSTLKLEERMKLHQWIKIQTRFSFKNLAKMKKSLVQ